MAVMRMQNSYDIAHGGLKPAVHGMAAGLQCKSVGDVFARFAKNFLPACLL
jgi:hypothetical protein